MVPLSMTEKLAKFFLAHSYINFLDKFFLLTHLSTDFDTKH